MCIWLVFESLTNKIQIRYFGNGRVQLQILVSFKYKYSVDLNIRCNGLRVCIWVCLAGCLSACVFVCLSVVRVTQKTIAPIDLIFFHKNLRSIIPVARSSFKMMRVGIQIWTQEFNKWLFTIASARQDNICHQCMPQRQMCVVIKTCIMTSKVHHSEWGSTISDCLVTGSVMTSHVHHSERGSAISDCLVWSSRLLSWCIPEETHPPRFPIETGFLLDETQPSCIVCLNIFGEDLVNAWRD